MAKILVLPSEPEAQPERSSDSMTEHVEFGSLAQASVRNVAEHGLSVGTEGARRSSLGLCRERSRLERSLCRERSRSELRQLALA